MTKTTGGPADELVLRRPGAWRDEGEDRAAVGRGHGDPPLAGREPGVEGQLEAQLIQVEPQAPVQIPNEHPDRVDPEVGVEPLV